LQVEAPTVAESYEQMVTETRQTAGAAIKRASKAQAADAFYIDVTDINYSRLAVLDQDFLNAQRDHLSIWPRPVHRLSRRLLEIKDVRKGALVRTERNTAEEST
jgi:hypothetical protein